MKTPSVSENNLPPEIVGQFIGNQQKQIALQEKQMLVNDKNNQNQFEYAKEALKVKAQNAKEALKVKAQNAKEDRAYNGKKLTKIFVFTGIVLVIFLVFILKLLAMGDSDIAKEIFQIVTFNITGAIGGYGYALKSKKSSVMTGDQT